jgi:phosphoglycerate dehydrogenase-like enzyme
MRVHFLYPPSEENQAFLENLLDRNIQVTYGEEIPTGEEIQILVAGRPKDYHFESNPTIETLIIPWAGLPPETTEVLKSFPGIKVHNIHHNATPAAELALALLLAVAKEILPHDQTLRAGDWHMRYRESKSQLLAGKTALILGYGEIGKLIKRYLTALGVEVLATKRTASEEDLVDSIFPPPAFKDLLPKAEILFLALPLTPDTEGMISKQELDLLPSNAILINISRAVIVDQEALYNALKSRRIYGAGLDVWYNYPKSEMDRKNTSPADFPFPELDNVVLSPHRGGKVDATEKMRMEGVAELLNAAAAGKPIPNPVDLKSGY